MPNSQKATSSVSEKGKRSKSSTSSKDKDDNSPTDNQRVLQLPIDKEDPDWPFKEKLTSADNLLKKGQYEQANLIFDFMLKSLPESPRALYGKAVGLDGLAEERMSNQLLEECIKYYKMVGMDSKVASAALQIKALERLADRAHFRGNNKLSIQALHKLYHELQPSSQSAAHRLGIAYLTGGQNKKGLTHFEQVVKKWPDDSFAKAHVGFVLYNQQKYEECLPLLLDGVYNDSEIRTMSKFFVYAGDTLMRLYRIDEARKVYREAVSLGLFPSIWQRSTYNEPNLRAQPFWMPKHTGHSSVIKKIEKKWKVIRDEGLALLDLKSGGFLLEDENLRESGVWNQFTLYARGKKDEKNCRKAPKTCALIDMFPEAASCHRGQVKFSVMYPGTHVWPHVGPTNCRLRMHLGLDIPEGVSLRVAHQTIGWAEGKFLIFDDSFEHEVWHNGTRARLILIADIWHPDIPPSRRALLSPI
jgi:aspartate beta-hydroxylase